MEKKYICLGIVISAALITLVVIAGILFYEPFPNLDDEFIETYRPVCNGIGVNIASEYNPTEQGTHPTILICSDGTRHKLTDQLRRDWWPENIIDVELVLVCDTEEYKVIQTCYYNGPSITRYRYYIVVRLRIAKTGSLLSEATIYGALPRRCQKWEDYNLRELWGKHVTIGEISDWLRPYV